MDFKEFRERYQYDSEKDLLGAGAFGRVYRARDLRLERWVALKVFTRDAPQQYDLISEIKRAIHLHHPNICRYHDAEVLRGMNAMGETQVIQVGIMEYVECGTIDVFLKQHPEFRQKLLMDVLRGLSYLHRRNPPILHRDLKPSNVLVGMEDGVPVAKITDFGISKSSSVSGANVSVAGLGTYAYMAPEQLNPARFGVGGKVLCNLDLWSFGAMTVELLTGMVPFGAGSTEVSTGEIFEAILEGIPPRMLAGFEEPYRTVLTRCMVQNVSERVQTAEEVLELFERMPMEYRGADLPLAASSSHGAALTAKVAPEPWQMMDEYEERAAGEPLVEDSPSAALDWEGQKSTRSTVILIALVALLVAGMIAWAIIGQSQSIASRTEEASPDTPYGKYLLGQMAIGGGSYTSALEIFKEACDGGSDDGCRSLADMYGSGLGTSKDSHLWEAYYGKFCDLGNASRCTQIGDALYAGNGMPKDYRTAADFYRKACDDNDAIACSELGPMYFHGEGVKSDFALSVSPLTKACDGGIAKSCTSLGALYSLGLGVRMDQGRGAGFYSKGCDGGDGSACDLLAEGYLGGDGVKKNPEKATELFRRGCNLGYARSCSDLKETQK